MKRRHADTPLASFAPDTTYAPPAVEFTDVRKSFGKTQVLAGVSLRVEKGERVAIIGPNGAGKSTLFDLASGRAKPTEGEIRLHGERIDGQAPERINRAGLARSFQITNVFSRLSVFDNLRCAVLSSRGYRGVFWRRLSALREVTAHTESLIDTLGLASRRNDFAGDLSYAEQRALEVGIAVAGDASVLLLDEPTAGMSQSETQRFIALIEELSRGRSLLMVEHDMSVVFALADRVAVLVQGTLMAFDTPDKVRSNARVQRAYLGTPIVDIGNLGGDGSSDSMWSPSGFAPDPFQGQP
ncbi:N/A [soil metagenome]